VGVAEADSGDVPAGGPAPAWAAPAWAAAPAESFSGEETLAEAATGQGALGKAAADGEPVKLVRIGVEAGPEPYPEDPWLPGSQRPDRRGLVIGVVVIAGLLAVASTAWLVGTNQPQAGRAHSSHQSRPAPLGSGHAQPSLALSGHPAPSLSPASQPAPAPARTSTTPARAGQSGAGGNTPGHRGTGHDGTGHGSTGHHGTGHGGTGHTGTLNPGSGQAGTQRTGSGQSAASGPGNGPPGPGQAGPGQPGSARSGSGPSRSGPPGTVRSTTPPVPQPHQSAPASRGGGKPRHPHGIVSIGPGLAGRAGVQRVATLLDRYFAAVNHREYQAYARLFAQRRQLTPGEFAWGYQTSHDSNATLVGVAALKGGLKAMVTFTSHQDPARSPDHSSCIDWRITLFLHRAGPVYLIGMPPSGYRAGLHACRFVPRHAAQAHSSSRHSSSQHGGSQHRGSRHPAAQPPRSRPRGRKNR
jgi:hypothetical protein